MDLVLFCFFFSQIFSFSLFLSSSILEKFRLVGFNLLSYSKGKEKLKKVLYFGISLKRKIFPYLSIRIRKEKDILYR